MDWNLIPTLDALLTERSVSGAARRLGLSQPAVSHALARLRRQFNDELLVRQGSANVLTPFAEQLASSTRDAVDALATVAASSSEFDPTTSSRTFTLAASDYAQAVLGNGLLAAIHATAPRATVSFVAPFSDLFATNEAIIDSTDGWFAPREMLPGRPHGGSVTDKWVCVVASDHPTVGSTLTLDDVRTNPWVAPTIRGNPLRLHLDGLAAHGIEPTIETTTETFTAVPFLVAGSRRIGILQQSLAELLAPSAAVRILECPWPVQPLQLTFWWSSKRESDPGHAWLRTLVTGYLDALDSPDAVGVPEQAPRPAD